ncbi:MAG TPA: prepilin-type N-terminal cleavage/methylation domain-containing protein [Methylophilaceae bacterium]|jgi:prepilin-type N-terminal cleavage/methylation domain-containing protein
MKKQSGFTLIELAIVLVIIGLLLGGVLKGQELINSAKVKNMASDFRNIQVYIYGYQDKYKAIPGDDSNAANHASGAHAATTPAGKQGNGVIEGNWDSTTITDESFLFWEHVRLAGLAPGTTTYGTAAEIANYTPKNADGGQIGVQSVSGFTSIVNNEAGAASAMNGAYVVCSTGVLGKYAKQLDTTLDDGEGDTGSVRITDSAHTTGKSITSANVADATSYTVCYAF